MSTSLEQKIAEVMRSAQNHLNNGTGASNGTAITVAPPPPPAEVEEARPAATPKKEYPLPTPAAEPPVSISKKEHVPERSAPAPQASTPTPKTISESFSARSRTETPTRSSSTTPSSGRRTASRSRASRPERTPNSSRQGTDTSVSAGARLYEKARQSSEIKRAKQRQAPPGCTFQPDIKSSAKNASHSTQDRTQRFNSLHAEASKKSEKLQSRKDQEATRGCTFKPEINAKSKKLDPNKKLRGEKRFDKLYKEEARRRIKQHQAQKEAEVKDCTFKPQITKVAQNMSAPATKKRFEILYSSKRESTEQLEEKKIEIELSGCTFKPKVNHRRSRSAPRSRPGAQVHDRLHNYGKENQAKIARKKQERENRVLENCTFSPSVNKQRAEQAGNSSRASHETIWERLHRPCTKEDMLSRLDQFSQDAECTFKPKIIRRSQSAGRQRPTPRTLHGTVFDRLHNDIEIKERDLEDKRQERLQQELEECTFAPKTTKWGRPMDASTAGDDSLVSDGELPVWERLQQNRQGIQMLRDEIKKAKDLEGCTFQPEIGRAPASLSSTMRSDVSTRSDSSEPVHERLSKKAKNYEMLSKIKEQQELESCTFMPKTNTSKRAPSPFRREVPGSHIWDRLSNQVDMQQRAAELEQRKKELELQGCTFKPDTKTGGMAGLSKREVMDHLNQRIADLSKPRAENDKRKQIEERWRQESKMPGYKRSGGRSSSARRARPSSASARSTGSDRPSSRSRTPTPRSRSRPSSSTSKKQRRPTSATRSRGGQAGGSSNKVLDKFLDWEKEMQAKMTMATSPAPVNSSASGSTMEQFHNWQAEIEAKMEGL